VKYESIDVRENPLEAKEARALVKKHSRLIAFTGKKQTEIDLKKEKISDEELDKLILGRSGTLRAPCLGVDQTFFAGYNMEVYKKYLKI